MIKIVEDKHKFYWVKTKAWFLFFLPRAVELTLGLASQMYKFVLALSVIPQQLFFLAVMFSVCLAVILLFKNISQVTIFGHTNSSWLEMGAVT